MRCTIKLFIFNFNNPWMRVIEVSLNSIYIYEKITDRIQFNEILFSSVVWKLWTGGGRNHTHLCVCLCLLWSVIWCWIITKIEDFVTFWTTRQRIMKSRQVRIVSRTKYHETTWVSMVEKQMWPSPSVTF